MLSCQGLMWILLVSAGIGIAFVVSPLAVAEEAVSDEGERGVEPAVWRANVAKAIEQLERSAYEEGRGRKIKALMEEHIRRWAIHYLNENKGDARAFPVLSSATVMYEPRPDRFVLQVIWLDPGQGSIDLKVRRFDGKVIDVIEDLPAGVDSTINIGAFRMMRVEVLVGEGQDEAVDDGALVASPELISVVQIEGRPEECIYVLNAADVLSWNLLDAALVEQVPEGRRINLCESSFDVNPPQEQDDKRSEIEAIWGPRERSR